MTNPLDNITAVQPANPDSLDGVNENDVYEKQENEEEARSVAKLNNAKTEDQITLTT